MYVVIFFFKQKTAYEMRISDWSSDVCSSDLVHGRRKRMSIEILDPTHEMGAPAFSLAARLPMLAGKTVGIVSNGKRGTRPFFDAVERELRSEERRVGTGCVSTGSSRLWRSLYKKKIDIAQ